MGSEATGPIDTWVVVPCFNEADRLRTDLFDAFLQNGSSTVGFVFVDDGSTDSTLEVLRRLCGDFPTRLRLVTLDANGGKAAAVRRGLNTVLADSPNFVGYWDADLSAPLEEIAGLQAVMNRRPGIDVVLGIRLRIPGHHIQQGWLRHKLGRIFALAASHVLDRRFCDTQCGAKLFRVTPTLRTALSAPFRSRWIFDIELLLRCRSAADAPGGRYGRVYEYPLETWISQGQSKLKPWYYAWSAVELVAIYLRDRPSRVSSERLRPENTAPEEDRNEQPHPRMPRQ